MIVIMVSYILTFCDQTVHNYLYIKIRIFVKKSKSFIGK